MRAGVNYICKGPSSVNLEMVEVLRNRNTHITKILNINTNNTMSTNEREKIQEYEKSVRAIMEKRADILRGDRPLTAEEVDYLFDSTHDIERWFEHQSMLLPLVEEEKTVSRWDSPVDALLKSLPAPHVSVSDSRVV